VSVNAASIDTDIKARDNHLKKEDYFYVERYPKISFISKTIIKEGAGQYKVTGMLEIKGVNKEINFTFTANPVADGYVFKGGFRINRKDFKVGGKSLILSDQLSVNLSVSARKN
ncbi:MAG: YceI family protein, partial [Chitinophagaceae bacterium]|nr:YceI family protein [Chitinophagaceae bacterium]